MTDATEVKETTEKKATRPKVPEGYVTPIQFRNALVEQDKAPADLRPQVIYTYVKNPGKGDPFPVKYTDGETVKDEQWEGTRPCLVLQEALDWWDRKAARKIERANKPKAEKKAKGVKATKKEEPEVVEEEVVEFDLPEAE